MKAFKNGRVVLSVLALLSVLSTAALGAEWGYHGEEGPGHWCNLDTAYSTCCEGMEQSPINIVGGDAQPGVLAPLEFSYPPVSVEVINNGHTVQANVPEGACTLTIGNETYNLLQFHFHTPSEHLMDGEEYPMELHLVHQSAGGVLAVVGVFIEPGDENAELAKFWGSIPATEEETATANGFEISQLLPENRATYRYGGSLTTPPCSEGVRWNVFGAPIAMSAEQIDAFISIFSGEAFPDGNRRPLVPLNDRTVVTDQTGPSGVSPERYGSLK